MTAKINTTEIKIKSMVPRVSKKLSVQRPPGLNSDAIEGLGSQGAELQISLQAGTLAEKHSWTAEFLKTGPQVLTDPDGYIYNIVESQANGGRDYESEPNIDQRWLFGFQCLMEEPYKFSSTEITRLKTITTNGQEWSTDDSANPITTAGTIDVIPDIEVVSGALGPDFVREIGTVDLLDTTLYSAGVAYVLVKTTTIIATPGQAYRIDSVGADVTQVTVGGERCLKVTIQATSLHGGVETDIFEQCSIGTGFVTLSGAITGEISDENEQVIIRYYAKGTNGAGAKNITLSYTRLKSAVAKDIKIYNTADTTRKVQICNEIAPGTTVSINKNGTGTYNYPDNFTTDTYIYVSYDYNDISYDDPNDRIGFGASDGYLSYRIDCKYPITGVPTLAVNVSGDIKIAIAEDVGGASGTFYDIDGLTGVAYSDDDVSFLLDSINNFRLKGETSFFLKIYTNGSTSVILNSFDFDADLVTIDTLLPFVYLGASNTFRADQNSDSSLNATVDLSYRDGHWVI